MIKESDATMAYEKNILKRILTAPELRSKAGGIYYSRGEEYFKEGYVSALEVGKDYVSAFVSGTHRYKVKLFVLNNELRSTCDCPLGRDMEFCKHKVALGLAYLNTDSQLKKDKTKSFFDWKEFVKNCSREDIEKIVFEMSPHCPGIIEKYRMDNLPFTSDALAVELKRKIDSLVSMAENCGYYEDDYDYDGDPDCNDNFCEGQKQLQKALDAVAKKKDYKLLFKIVEYAIEQIRKTSTYEEEPVSDFLDSMLTFYIQCASAGVETPEHIVEKIQAWENNNSYCGFGNLEYLFDRLPKAVQQLWFERARAYWEKLTPLKMGTNNDNNYRRRLEGRLLSMAKAQGDTALSLEIMKRNLSRDHDVIVLVNEFRHRKMFKETLVLLQEARSKFPHSREIRDALAAEQQKLGNHEDAIKVAWKEFESNPLSDESFTFLLKVAQKAKKQTETFEKALAFLTEYEEIKAKSRSYYWDNRDTVRARRVEILLDAGRNEQAWELGRDAQIGETLKLRIAEWRSVSHPEEAATLCNTLLENALKPTGDDAYEHVVKLLFIYREYMNAAGKTVQFEQYCNWIKIEFKRRRKLVELMNRKHL